MTEQEERRLAHLRAQNLKNQFIYRDAHCWDSVFLMGIIDDLIEEREQLRQETSNLKRKLLRP